MSPRYLSPQHREDDPGGLIAQALEMGPEFPGPAEDLLLAWSLGLAEGVEAADAARSLLERHRLAEGALPADERGRLAALLREAAVGKLPMPARRGGWRGRRGAQKAD